MWTALTCKAAEVEEPQIQPASSEGELAKEGIQVPEGIEVDLFAAEPLLANPVAFCFDAQGRIYVCETFRQQKGVEDNRSHMVWLEDDLAARSVADRLAYFRKHLGDGIAEYAKHQDRIRRLEDTNGDGKADVATVFAGPFHEIEEGTGAGVLAVDGAVYYANIPRLWLFNDSDGDGVADGENVLADGFGVRVAFRGHDMHGLTLGPDGRLYFSIGDRGYNVTTHEGRRLVRPDTGAVFRCELDGSDLEVFAYGLRNPQELAFDDYGNLFTGDNNSDSGDQARWVQVVEGSDSGWRMYYQYLEDRGPWNRERMWYPYESDDETTRVQPAYIVPPIANVSDGPSGLVYYPGVGLSERYKGHFFLADFRGSSSNSGIRSFAVEPQGATFKLVDDHWFLQNLLATDVDFGYDGKLYVTDWVDGWNGPGKGRIYTFTAPNQTNAAQTAGVADLFADGIDQQDSDSLVQLLSHADRRVRQGAQLALTHAGDISTLTALATDNSAKPIPRLHAVWTLWEIARRTPSEEVSQALRNVAESDHEELRAQACRVLGDLRDASARETLRSAVQFGSPREQYFAAIGLGRLPRETYDSRSLNDLAVMLANSDDEDPVVRHAAVMGMVGCGTPDAIAEYRAHDSPSVRLGAALALRRHHSASVAKFLDDDNPRVIEAAARAIHDEPIAEALPFLAGLIDRPAAEMSDLLLRRVVNANYRLGGPVHAASLAKLAGDEAASDSIRGEALFALLHWDQPPNLDRVTNEYRPLPPRSLDVARPSVQELAPQLLAMSGDRRRTAVELIAKYRLAGHEKRLLAIASDAAEPAPLQAAALTALLTFDTPETAEALQVGLNSKAPAVRMAAHQGLVRVGSPTAVNVLTEAIAAERSSVAERQQAIALLASVDDNDADASLAVLLKQLAEQPSEVPPAIHLDLLTAAEQSNSEQLTSLLNIIEIARDPADPLAAYRVCLQGGDVERGRQIFFGNAAASCRRCHLVNGEGSNVGPDLSAIGKEKDREYLLQSIIDPNAKIAKGFETVVLVMDDGRLYTGLIKAEDEDTYQLMTAQGELIRIDKASIEARAAGKSGMPEDVAKPLTKAHLRDLVEYLSTLKTRPADSAAHGKEGE